MSRNRSTSAKATISSNFDLISRLRHAEDRAVEEDVFAPGQLRVKTGADFEQARDPAAQDRASAVGSVIRLRIFNSVDFAGPVPADDAEHLALLDLEAHVPQGPEFLDLVALHDLPAADEIDRLAREIAGLAGDHVAQCGVPFALGGLMADQIALRRFSTVMTMSDMA